MFPQARLKGCVPVDAQFEAFHSSTSLGKGAFAPERGRHTKENTVREPNLWQFFLVRKPTYELSGEMRRARRRWEHSTWQVAGIPRAGC
jgi:hypothetical protein